MSAVCVVWLLPAWGLEMQDDGDPYHIPSEIKFLMQPDFIRNF